MNYSQLRLRLFKRNPKVFVYNFMTVDEAWQKVECFFYRLSAYRTDLVLVIPLLLEFFIDGLIIRVSQCFVYSDLEEELKLKLGHSRNNSSVITMSCVRWYWGSRRNCPRFRVRLKLDRGIVKQKRTSEDKNKYLQVFWAV